MATSISPPPSPLPTALHAFMQTPSTSAGATHPPSENAYPDVNAKPTATRRRSARLSIPAPLPAAPEQPAQVSEWTVPFPSGPSSSSSAPPAPMPNTSVTPTRTRTRKRARPSESGEVARRAVEALVTPSRSRKSRSPVRDGVSEKKRRRVSLGRGGVQEEQGVSEMEVEVALPPVPARRARTRSTAGIEKVELPTDAATSSTSVAPIPVIPTPTRPNHRKRKSMSALDDIRRELIITPAVTPALEEEAIPPQSTRKKLRKSVDVDAEGTGSAPTVTFAVDGKGKGREKERSPARGKRGSRATKSAVASTSVEVGVSMQDVEMVEASPATEPIRKLGRRKSMRKLAPILASTQELSTTAIPSEHTTPPPPSSPTPHTPLGAAAAILASTSNAATLSPSALTSPTSSPSAPARRFTRSSLAINTQDPAVALPHTSPLSSPRQLSPLSPPTSPLSTTSSLDLPLSPNQVASAQTQAKAPAKLVAEAAVAASSRGVSVGGSGSGRASGGLPTRRIATRSSGLPLVVAEWGVAAGSGRRRTPSSPLAAVGSTVPESPEKDKAEPEQGVAVAEGSVKGKEKEKEAGAEVNRGGKGKGKVGRKRGGGVRVKGPARRSSRLSGVESPPSDLASTSTAPMQPAPQALPIPIASPSPIHHQPQPQSHTPPSSPPSPPPLRLSLASLSPPMPASGHKPHTRSPLSGSSSHQGQHSGGTSPLKEGSTSPLKENASLSGIASTSSSTNQHNTSPASSSSSSGLNLGGSSNGGKQSTMGMQGGSVQSHTPPGSPTRGPSMAMQMEIDAVDFGTPLPGPMQFNLQIQTSPPHPSQQQGGSGAGKQVERPGSPTSPTERRVPLMPSTLLGVGAVPMRSEGEGGGERGDAGKGKERERERGGVEEVESGRSTEEGSSMQQGELGGMAQVSASTIGVSADVVPLPSSEPALDENTPLQPLYPALIQVEIPPAPQPLPPQTQLEPGQQQFADSATVFEGQAEQQQQDVNVQYQQQQYAPPPPQPSYTQWEEPPRLDNERSLWRLACKVRVWDLRRRYSLETIRSLVTHEAHEYYAKNGFPSGYFTSSSSSPYGPAGPSLPSGLNAAGLRTHASQLRAQALRRQVSGGSSTSSEGDPTSPVNFMDEEVYDWEIATSDDEEGFLVEEDEDEDEEDYEDLYDDEDEGEGEQVEGGLEDEGAAPVSVVEGGEEGEKKDGGEEEKEEVRETSVEVEGEIEEERLKRRRRRSSLLRHLRKPSGEFDDVRSPSPAVQDDPSNSGDAKEGEEEDEGEMDIDIDLDIEDLDEALEDPNFNLELSASTTASPTSPQQVSPASPSPIGSPTSGPSNGVFTSFYVPPVPQAFSPQSLPVAIADPSTSALSAALGTPVEAAASSPSSPAPPSSLLMDGTVSSSPPPPAEVLPPVQIPLQTIAIPMHIPTPTPPPIIDMPPPRLSSVPVWALRNMEMSGGNMGKGTPVNRDRATEWGNVWSMDVARSRSVSVMAVDGGLIAKKDGDDFGMNVDRGSGSGDSGKPVLRLALPGEGGASSSGPAGTSASMGPSGSKLMDGTFEPSNQADWEAFLASLAPGPGGSSSSSLMGAQPMMQQGMPDHHQAPPPPYSSHNPNPLQQSPPPTPTPPSPASSTSSLHENAAALGGGSMTVHSPGTSQAGMFGMMNVNMMFGMPGSQGGGNTYAQQIQPQPHSQLPMQPQQGVNDGNLNQPSFPPMGLTMQMPPPTMNSMGPQHGSYNNSGMQQSFNSMPFNMGMGLGMNPQTMNMNVPLNVNMGMGTMSMPMMQMPMSMPFAGLQLGLTVSLAPHQHSAQQHHQHQAQQQQNQIQWMGGGNVSPQGSGPMEYDLASGMGMGPGGPMGEGMFSLVNGTPTNTPLNSPLSPSSASIPSSMLGVLGGPGPSSPGPMSPESEKGPGAAATSALSYALG